MDRILNYALQRLKEAGADKASVEIVVSDKHELNTETNSVKLLRSTENVILSLNYIKDHKKGSLAINKYDEVSIDEAVKSVVNLSNASPVDEAYDIAPVADGEFICGIMSPDLDAVYDALYEFTQEVQSEYPKILGDAVLSYDFKKRYIINTNGLNITESKGIYNFMMMFSAKDKDKITSFNYTGASTDDLKGKLLELGQLGELLIQTEKELEAKPLGDKFVGDVIITPHCMNDVIGMYAGIALTDGPMISGTSLLKEKLNECVASEKLTWHSNPKSIVSGYAVTPDGIEAEDMTVIEKGVLKSFILSQYGGNKTGLGYSKNLGQAYVIEPGDNAFKDMLKAVKKGVLLCRFSGGMPGPDGTFSGVAKNSFYIENGEVKFPMSETMISGNLFKMMNDIKGISTEQVNFGDSQMPYVYTTGVTISSK